jgi:SAM-dependent methyltransferase
VLDHVSIFSCDEALRSLDDISNRGAADAIGFLVPWLHKIKRSLPTTEWQLFKEACSYHPIVSLLHQDPFTRWSYKKPRGYSGDARLLDFIYGQDIEDELNRTSLVGRSVYQYTCSASAPDAVRERCTILSELVDSVAKRAVLPIEVLSIAAGHLRESERSGALQTGRIRRWVALDQDAESIATIERSRASISIQTVLGSARDLIAGRCKIGTFDVIYSAGLYDYLSDRMAKRLTEVIFEMLKPGGRMLYANFSRDIPDDGYMEAFMAWQLIYRTESEMRAFADGLPIGQVRAIDAFWGSNRNIIYVMVKKK